MSVLDRTADRAESRDLSDPPRRPRSRVWRVVRPVIWSVAILAGGSILWFLPRTTGTTWHEIWRLLTAVSALDILWLTLLWAAGLVTYCAFVLTGALPGLRPRRALTLNLTGSAVANVMPLGGAAGVGLNVVMLRRWGYLAKDIASFLMISNIWNVLAKLALSAAVVGVLAAGGLPVPVSADTIRTVAISAAVAIVILVSGVAFERVARTAGRYADAVTAWVLARLRVKRRTSLERQLPAVRAVMLSVLRRRWLSMSAGMALYLALQGALLWGCLHILGNRFTAAAVLTAFAVDRLLTAVPLTPGGSGVVEAGVAGALIALGGAPASVAAAVLLYRAFTFLAEIPIGGIWAIGWFARERRTAAAAGVSATAVSASPS